MEVAQKQPGVYLFSNFTATGGGLDYDTSRDDLGEKQSLGFI